VVGALGLWFRQGKVLQPSAPRFGQNSRHCTSPVLSITPPNLVAVASVQAPVYGLHPEIGMAERREG